MMKILAFFSLIIFCLTGFAQKGNVIYLEAGGNGIVQTFNYERQTSEVSSGVSTKGFRIGFGLSPKYTIDTLAQNKGVKIKGIATSVVLGYNMHFNWGHSGMNPNRFELGINTVVVTKKSMIEKIWEYEDKIRIFPSLNIGYRYQKVEEKGLMFRVCYSPFYISSGLKHWGGISIGYSFN